VEWPWQSMTPGGGVVQGATVGFSAGTSSSDGELRYKWKITGGRITGNDDSKSISVDTTGLGGQRLDVAVDIDDRKGCKTRGRMAVGIVQSRESVQALGRRAQKNPARENPVPVEFPYTRCSQTAEKLNLIAGIFDSTPVRRPESGSKLWDRWRNYLNICPLDKDNMLDQSKNLRLELGSYTNGVYGDSLSFRHFTNGGTIVVEGDKLIWDLTPVKDTPGDYAAVFKINDGCGTGSVVARTVHITNYCATCLAGYSTSNFPGYREEASLTIDLIGTPDPSVQKDVTFEWTGGGEITEGQGTNSARFRGWMLEGLDSGNPYPKDTLDAKVEIGGLKNSGTLSFTADLPLFYDLPERDPPADEKDREILENFKKKRENIREEFRKHLKFEWSLMDPRGKPIAAGKTSGAMDIDLKNLNIPDKVVLSVKISGIKALLFFVTKFDDPVENSLLFPDLFKCRWTVTPGAVIWGEGTSAIVVGDLESPYGTPVTATAECEGPDLKSCHNKISIFSEVGRMGEGGFANTNSISNTPAPSSLSRPAQVNPANTATTQTVIENEIVEASGSTTRPPPSPSPTPAASTGAVEREFLNIAWPGDPVYPQQPFSIIVSYNRRSDAVEITDTAGRVVTELRSKDFSRLFKDRWGSGTEVLAQMRLQSAGLYTSDTVTCSPNCQADYLPLISAEQKWPFSVTAHNPGEKSFNLEMWIKPKAGGDPEKVWEKTDLKINVRREIPTGTQILVSSGLVCMLGLFFFVRGTKFGGIRIMIAGGDIVGRDKAGGDIVAGDKIGGDKGK
jgi:hypothetical protein